MENGKIDITKEVDRYFELKYTSEAYGMAGEKEKAGQYSFMQTQLHSKIASNICFFGEDPEAARKVMSDFFKKASVYSDYFSKKGSEIDYDSLNLRSHCFIYNDEENNSVKVTVESSGGNVNEKVEYKLEDGRLSDVEGEPVNITLPLDTFRSGDEDPNSIPFNKKAERIIRSRGLVPAYWTSGFSHANRWFMDGISQEMAKELLSGGNGDHKGGKYSYIASDTMEEEKEEKRSAILEMMKRINNIVF